MTDSAFCWVNGVGMPHEWRMSGTKGILSCKRCGKIRMDSWSVPKGQEGQDAPKTDSPPENEGQNA